MKARGLVSSGSSRGVPYFPAPLFSAVSMSLVKNYLMKFGEKVDKIIVRWWSPICHKIGASNKNFWLFLRKASSCGSSVYQVSLHLDFKFLELWWRKVFGRRQLWIKKSSSSKICGLVSDENLPRGEMDHLLLPHFSSPTFPTNYADTKTELILPGLGLLIWWTWAWKNFLTSHTGECGKNFLLKSW